ncbi:MAG TPA: hypothetical protein VHX64_11880, partial [Caulobacteraceae bacterium]|nr:hypothetical protein [Caulobacteraceae bacterium]
KGTPTMGPLPGDPQSCIFSDGDDSITVSIRPGLGTISVKEVLSGATNVQATPVTGVGEQASWTPILHEISATKNNVLCNIGTDGAPGFSPTQQQFGDLCNKIFGRM